MTSDFTHRLTIAAHFYNSGKVNKLHLLGYELPCSSVWLHIDAQNLIKIGLFLGVLGVFRCVITASSVRSYLLKIQLCKISNHTCNKGVIGLSIQGIPKSAMRADNNLFSMLCMSAPYFLLYFLFGSIVVSDGGPWRLPPTVHKWAFREVFIRSL